jgi:nitrite reductase/ring-hydroxylating ferredoxin subunit
MADPQAGRSPARSGLWLEVGVALPPPGGMAAFEAGGLRLVLCNAGGVPYAVQDRCPHAFAYLSGGRLEGCVLECPLHGGKLDVRDGRPVAAPIRKPVRTFAVRHSGARLQVAIE